MLVGELLDAIGVDEEEPDSVDFSLRNLPRKLIPPLMRLDSPMFIPNKPPSWPLPPPPRVEARLWLLGGTEDASEAVPAAVPLVSSSLSSSGS